MTEDLIEEVWLFAGETIENGYGIKKSVEYLKKEYKLSDKVSQKLDKIIRNYERAEYFEDYSDLKKQITKLLNKN